MCFRFYLRFVVLVIFLLILFPGLCNKGVKTVDISLSINPGPKIASVTPNELKTDLSIDKDYLIGKFDFTRDTAFVRMDDKFGKENIYIRKPVYEAFKKMYNAALKDSIHLKVISGTRCFDIQKYIWEAKWKGKRKVGDKNLFHKIPDEYKRAKKILKYSSMPGISRHHWGTEIDLNSLNIRYFETPEGKKVFEWLQQNASSYGFYRPYTAKGKNRRLGFEEEKWHWSYIPLAKPFLQEYLKTVTYDDIKGFEGHEFVDSLEVISCYVEGISMVCK